MDTAEFTGERIAPEAENYFFFEHFARYRWARDYLSHDHRVLDVGCGDGYGTFYVSRDVEAATGIDVCKHAIRAARDKYRSPRLSYLDVAEGSWPNVPERSHDIALCFEVFEQIANPAALLRRIKGALKDGGVLLISTSNRALYGDKIPVPCHVREYDLEGFKNTVEEVFEIEAVYGQRNRRAVSRRLNHWMARTAMRHGFVLQAFNWLLSRRQRQYASPACFDRTPQHGNLISSECPEEADYFILLCRRRESK